MCILGRGVNAGASGSSRLGELLTVQAEMSLAGYDSLLVDESLAPDDIVLFDTKMGAVGLNLLIEDITMWTCLALLVVSEKKCLVINRERKRETVHIYISIRGAMHFEAVSKFGCWSL
jgi:hypothetical protein